MPKIIVITILNAIITTLMHGAVALWVPCSSATCNLKAAARSRVSACVADFHIGTLLLSVSHCHGSSNTKGSKTYLNQVFKEMRPRNLRV